MTSGCYSSIVLLQFSRVKQRYVKHSGTSAVVIHYAIITTLIPTLPRGRFLSRSIISASATTLFLNYSDIDLYSISVHVSPIPSMPSLNTIVPYADMNRVQHRISSFGFSHIQTVYRLFYPIVRFFLQKLQMK